MILAKAARHGHISVLEYMSRTVDIRPYIGGCLVERAIKGSQYETIRWLWERRRYFPAMRSRDAAKTGDVPFCAWLMCEIPRGNSTTRSCLPTRAPPEASAMARYLMEVYGLRPNVDGINYAARHGHMHLVRWLVEEEKVRRATRTPFSTRATSAIARSSSTSSNTAVPVRPASSRTSSVPTSDGTNINARIRWAVPSGWWRKRASRSTAHALGTCQRIGPADAWTIGDQALQDRLDDFEALAKQNGKEKENIFPPQNPFALRCPSAGK